MALNPNSKNSFHHEGVYPNISGPIPPLWKVQIDLSSDAYQSNVAKENLSLNISPCAEQFQTMINQLLMQYEKTVSSFSSLLEDDRLRTFYTSKSSINITIDLDTTAQKKVLGKKWPFPQDIFHEFIPYIQSTSRIKMLVSCSTGQVIKISEVSVKFHFATCALCYWVCFYQALRLLCGNVEKLYG